MIATEWLTCLLVFLGFLENFKGILFLTTNRPGTLDEAVKSRIQVNICYKPLDLNQTVEIFKLNIEQLTRTEAQQSAVSGNTALVIWEKQILTFAKEHYLKNESRDGLGRWNGRQIRNAFLIASSLAQYEVLNEPSEVKPQLMASHFEEVERLTLDYDRSRINTLGKSDSQLAHQSDERYDFSEPLQTAYDQRSSPSHSSNRWQAEPRGGPISRATAGPGSNAESNPRPGLNPLQEHGRHRGAEYRGRGSIGRDFQ